MTFYSFDNFILSGIYNIETTIIGTTIVMILLSGLIQNLVQESFTGSH